MTITNSDLKIIPLTGLIDEGPAVWLQSIAEPCLEAWTDDDIEIDGLRACSKCRTAKEIEHDLGEHGILKLACFCECELGKRMEESRQIRENERLVRMERMRHECLRSPELLRCTLDSDDSPSSMGSKFIRRYMDLWDQMRDNGVGLLLSGGVGTGKSFFASAVANAVIDKGGRAYYITVPDAISTAWNKDEWHKLLSKIDTYDLIVLDDLGAERDTEYAIEQVYTIVDRRNNSGMPLIVTTNLSLTAMRKRPTLQSQRIYDRIDQICPLTFELKGQSRRKGVGDSRKEIARQLMQGFTSEGGDGS